MSSASTKLGAGLGQVFDLQGPPLAGLAAGDPRSSTGSAQLLCGVATQ
jgi:hypothetical protein